jgi:hypothetical protein
MLPFTQTKVMVEICDRQECYRYTVYMLPLRIIVWIFHTALKRKKLVFDVKCDPTFFGD